MTKEYEATLEPRRHRAIQELTELVKQHYPTASFAVVPAEDEPDATHIITTVDLDDPDEVVDLVIDRMLELQIDDGIRTPERTTVLQHQLRRRDQPVTPMPPAQL
jgi:hypothetical protein